MHVVVVGGGFVGCATAAALAERGERVTLIERDEAKLNGLTRGRLPFHEPGLDEAFARMVGDGRIVCLPAPVEQAGALVVAVGTPPDEQGRANLSHVFSAVDENARWVEDGGVVVLKSTVPPGTCDRVSERLSALGEARRLDAVSCPEFLREGMAWSDVLGPSRIVIGARRADDFNLARRLFEVAGRPCLETDPVTAELIKYGSNCFLALKISFANEMAELAAAVGADMRLAAEGIGLDPRIGSAFLGSGLGYGGYCLPKDLDALIAVGRERGAHTGLLEAVRRRNLRQIDLALAALATHVSPDATRRVALLGLAFKPGTDDIRLSPSISLARCLVAEGYGVVAHDPLAVERTRAEERWLTVSSDLDEVVRGASAIVVATAWDDYRRLDWNRLARLARGALVLDCRDCIDETEVRQAGFGYASLSGGFRR